MDAGRDDVGEVQQQGREVAGVGGAPDLVLDDTQDVAGL